MALQVVYMCIVLLGHAALSASGSCGSLRCSQEYSPSCPPDMSAHLYDNSMSTKSRCNKPIGPADSLSVDCYDMCVRSYFGFPVQSCADLTHAPGSMSVKKDLKTSDVVIEIHPPAVKSNFYQLNKFCKYNIQCPNENYMLHYTVVRMNIEPPDASGHCLDFLRFNFNITGKNKISDLCGSHESLTDDVIHGYHGSHLTLEFRSNRIHSRGGFYVGIVCILPSTTVQPKIGYKGYGYKGSRYGYKGYGYKGHGYRLRSCSSPRGLRPRRGLTLRSTNKPTTAKEFFDKVFPGYFTSRYNMIVTRGGVVKYRNKVIVVEHKGRIIRRFRGIKKLQVHNRIEGYLNFVDSSSPSGRTFPGYGFLRVGRRRIAHYVQTIVDPRYLLTDEEEETVRKLFKEHYNQRKFKNYYYYSYKSQARRNKICGINRLAKENIASCSAVVKAVSNFFLKTDPRQNFCYPTSYKPRFH